MGNNKSFLKLLVFAISIALFSSLTTAWMLGFLAPQKEIPYYPAEQRVVLVNDTLAQDAVVTSVFSNAKDSVVYIKSLSEETGFFDLASVEESTGTGMIINSSGYILTNHHVVENANEVNVTLSNGDKWPAEVIGSDIVTDVAVLKISPDYKLKPVELGDSDSIRPGQLAIAIGNPYVLENTLTVGIISGINRTLLSNGYRIHGVIQTDAAINPGNSGGPLLNSKGEVIGITSAIFTVSGGFQGIGFAIPINTAKKVADQLIDKGKVTRPWLGITGSDVTPETAEAFNLSVTKGALLIEVTPDGPAGRAGLRGTESYPWGRDFVAGDVIINIGGEKVNDMDDLLEILFKYKIGETVEVTYIREGKEITTKVTLSERPK